MPTIKEILSECDSRMNKALDALKNELVKIRTGRASTALLDTVRVEAYGQMSPINQIASLSVPDAHTITIQPWDKSMLSHIEKAIKAANLGLNPMNDGQLIRVPMPPLTEERRKEIVKLVKKFGEEAKVSVRNARRDAMESLKKSEKDAGFSEDERKRAEDDVQKRTDGKVKEVDNVVASKEKEVMQV
jgi:ribosome recycling factor